WSLGLSCFPSRLGRRLDRGLQSPTRICARARVSATKHRCSFGFGFRRAIEIAVKVGLGLKLTQVDRLTLAFTRPGIKVHGAEFERWRINMRARVREWAHQVI